MPGNRASHTGGDSRPCPGAASHYLTLVVYLIVDGPVTLPVTQRQLSMITAES